MKELEKELRADKAKAEKIKRCRKGMDLASVNGHKDLLAPSVLMRKQTELNQLHERSRKLSAWETEYLDKAEQWELLATDSGELKSELFRKLDVDDQEAFSTVCNLARHHPDAVAVLGWNSMRFMTPLINAATEGNRAAAEELARIALVATRTITELSAECPDLFSGIAPKSLDWPVMVSRKKNFHLAPEALLERLQQGYRAVMPIIPESNWTKDDTTGRVAWSLWQYVYHWREVARAIMADDSWGLELDTFQRRASQLDEFNAEDAWKDWWEVAKVALSEAYPDFETNDTLQRIGAPKRERKRNSRNRWRVSLPQTIHRDLRDKFRSFAGANRTRQTFSRPQVLPSRCKKGS